MFETIPCRPEVLVSLSSTKASELGEIRWFHGISGVIPLRSASSLNFLWLMLSADFTMAAVHVLESKRISNGDDDVNKRR